MKRSITVIISIVMVLILCACGASENTNTKTSAGSTTSKKLEKPTADTAEQAQKPEQADITQNADIAEETVGNDTSLAVDADISPEFKAAMDSYEAFFSEYVAFLQDFSDNPSDLSLLTKYIDYMDQYTETMEALDNIDDDELTTAELSYYIEVMGRIQQMLLSAAG